MALVWEKQSAGTLYQVRSAGRTLRLYSNGVYHSQYNPSRRVSFAVWDLLSLPALLQPAGSVKRVLVLGVGGGAVIHQLNDFVKPQEIVGVELSAEHLYVARHFFKLRYRNTRLIRGDAARWLRDYQGPGFDLIVDDLYAERDGEPVRAVAMNKRWLALLTGALTADGMLVANFVDRADFRTSALHSMLPSKFQEAFVLSNPRYQNRVVAALRRARGRRHLRENMQQHRELRSAAFARSYTFRSVAVHRPAL